MTNDEAINLLDNLIGMVEDNQNSDYDKALHMGINSLKAEPHWIPCSERLPEKNKTVLITIAFDNSKYIEFGHIYERTWEYLAESGSDYWEEVNGVIAWMPLPAPYQAERKDE